MHAIKRFGLAAALIGALGAGGCSTTGSERTWAMSSTDKAPAAQAQVKVAKQDDGNNKIKVEAEHLALPEQVYQGTNAYVVWLRPTEAGGGTANAKNVGSLNVNSDRKAKLETVTPFQAFQVFITAEPNARATQPSDREIFGADVTSI